MLKGQFVMVIEPRRVTVVTVAEVTLRSNKE